MADKRPSPADPIEKGLPANLEAERLVLGSILLDDANYVLAAATLKSEHFTLEKHRRIFARMGEIQERGEHIDRITVANELMKFSELESCDGISYLISLDEGLPKIPNLDSYIRIVKEKADLRSIVFASQHLMSRALAGEETSAEILAGASDSLLTMGGERPGDGPQNPQQILANIPGGISGFLGARKKGLLTGFSRFDDMTGGFHPGELFILAARPSMGKSALALNIAEHVTMKLGKTAMLFSLEMSKEALLHRLMCSRARVDSQRVRQEMINAEERHRLARALSEIAEAELYIDDKSAATLADMHAKVRKHIALKPLDLLIVDYLQLMSAGRNFENKNQEVTYLSRGLKLLAARLGVPILALSQLSRAPEQRRGNNRPQLSDLRESGSIEQDADAVAFIFREEIYNRDREDLRGLAELILAKQREGPIGTINLVFIHSCTKFANRAEDAPPDTPPLSLGGADEYYDD